MAISKQQLDILRESSEKNLTKDDRLNILRGSGAAESQRLRSFLQGLTFNTSDEIEAFLRTLGGEEYKDVRNEIRQKIKDYQKADPMGSFGYEMAGAALPTIAGAFLPGGQALAATRGAGLLKMAGVGATEGALTGYGSSEQEDIAGQLGDVATGGTVGAFANPILNKLGGKVVSGVGASADALRSAVGKRPSTPVVSELQRIAEGTGKSLDQIIQDIDEGRILAEDPSLAGVVRAIKSKGSEKAGSSGARIISTLKERATTQADIATASAEGVLAPNSGRNVYKTIMNEEKLLKDFEKEGYEKVFSKHKELSPSLVSDLEETLKRFPEVRNELQSYYQESSKKIVPLFISKDNNVVEFARMPSLEDAEIAYRILRDKAGELYKSGSGTRAENYKDAASGIKNMLDNNYLDLKEVRLVAAARRSGKEAFEEGTKAFGRNADEVEFDYAALLAKNPDAAKLYKAGVLHSFRNRMKRSASVAGKAAEPGRQEGAILKIVAGDDYEGVLQRNLKNAGLSQEAVNRVVYNSMTAPEMAARASIGKGKLSMAEMASIATGNPTMLAAMVSAKLAKSFEGDQMLSPKDYETITSVLLSQDPEFVARMINDEVALGDIKKRIMPIVNLGAQAAERGLRYQATTGGTEFSRNAYKGGLMGLLP